MVYTKDNSLVVTCNCGCNAIMTVKVIDELVFISFASSDYYTYQSNFLYGIANKANVFIHNLLNRAYYLTSLCLTDGDMADFISAINLITVKDGGEICDNTGVIELSKDTDFPSLGFISLISHSNLYDILRGRVYRDYEIVFNKEQWENFKQYAKRKFIA